jgi:hypothetical protein
MTESSVLAIHVELKYVASHNLGNTQRHMGSSLYSVD